MKKLHCRYIVTQKINCDKLSELLCEMNIVPNNWGYQDGHITNVPATCDWRVIGDFELIYVLEGETIITLENRTMVCHAGDFIFLLPYLRHKIDTSKHNPHVNYWIHFDVYPLYMHSQFISLMGAHVIHHKSEYAEELYRNMHSKVSGPGGYAMLKATLMLIIIDLVGGSGVQARQEVPNLAARKVVDKATEFIQDNLKEAIDVQSLCLHLHISKSHLYKAFMRVLGMPPGSYIHILKLKLAEQLLKTSQMSIKEISEMLCFSSPYYFSNVFKKYYKLSPSKFIASCKMM